MSMLIGTRRVLLGGLRLLPFKFDAAQTVFVPGMAKRIGPGPFAAAPIVQGKWDGSGVPDVLSFPRGALISGNFYANFDGNQGGGFCFWTPEQATNARTGDAYIWYVGSNYYLKYDYTNDRYELSIGGQTMTVAAVLVAGTMEILAWGFDTNNDLDTTNYAYLSRNNVQTYGMAVQPTAAAPDATIYIGSDGSASPSSGVVEALVFVREVPWTGVHGTDMGQGDIVAAHFAAGVGVDVALSIGSWGTTFSLPTNGAPGALTTGAGNAWSQPHAAAEANLTDAFCQTTYGASAWNTESTPSVGPADLAAGEKIFLGGYKWTCDAANEGVTQTIAGLAAGKDYALRVIAHCTSANDIRVRIWDETNGEQARGTADFDFGASSSRTQPGAALFCFELPTIARSGAAADCISISIKILGTANTQEVFLHQVELQENLIDNPGLETGAGNPWLPDGWANAGLDAGEGTQDALDYHSGASAAHANANTGEGWSTNAIPGALGTFLSLGCWSKATSGTVAWQMSNAGANDGTRFGVYWLRKWTGNTWTHIANVVRKYTVAPTATQIYCSGGNAEFRLDDVYSFALTPVSLTVAPASAINSAETSGLRVDGYDDCDQPLTKLKANKGIVKFKVTQRHNPADVLKFGQTEAYIFDLYEDANNYLRLYWSAVNTLTIAYNAQGAGVVTGTHNAAAETWVATEKSIQVKYGGAGAQLYINGALAATAAGAVAFTSDPSVAINWLHKQDGTAQLDATIA